MDTNEQLPTFLNALFISHDELIVKIDHIYKMSELVSNYLWKMDDFEKRAKEENSTMVWIHFFNKERYELYTREFTSSFGEKFAEGELNDRILIYYYINDIFRYCQRIIEKLNDKYKKIYNTYNLSFEEKNDSIVFQKMIDLRTNLLLSTNKLNKSYTTISRFI